MPYVTIDLEDIYNDLDRSDKENLVEWLKEDGCITKRDTEFSEPQSAVEQLFEEDIDKIRRLYLTMSREDMDTINQIAKKY
jgi:hypothetical protein